jgi:hypothetical protein
MTGKVERVKKSGKKDRMKEREREKGQKSRLSLNFYTFQELRNRFRQPV